MKPTRVASRSSGSVAEAVAQRSVEGGYPPQHIAGHAGAWRLPPHVLARDVQAVVAWFFKLAQRLSGDGVDGSTKSAEIVSHSHGALKRAGQRVTKTLPPSALFTPVCEWCC